MSVSGYPAYYMNESKASSYDGYDMEMKRFPSAGSIAGHSAVSGSRKSLYSNYTGYTVSNTSYILPIITKAPDPIKRPPDNWGFAFCSLFINPLFGLLALLFAEKSKLYYSRSDYKRAGRYGAYAKGTAAGGIGVMIVLIMLIVAIACWNRFRYAW